MKGIIFQFYIDTSRCDIAGEDDVSALVAQYLREMPEDLVFEFLNYPEKYSFSLGSNGDVRLSTRDGKFFIAGSVFDVHTEEFKDCSGEVQREELEVAVKKWSEFKRKNKA